MNAIGQTIDQKRAFSQPTSTVFVPNVGYVSAGPLKMPSVVIFPAARCLPPIGALNDSIHELWSPNRFRTFKMAWRLKTWQPLQMQGNRLGYTADYLAAHGWEYKGPA